MKEPLWKRAGRFIVYMAALGPILLFCLVAIRLELCRLEREGVME